MRKLICVLIFFAAAPLPAEAAMKLLSGTSGSGSFSFSLVDVNPKSVAVTNIGSSTFHTGLDFTPDGSRLYGLSDALRILNPLNGTYTTVGPLTLNGGSSILMTGMSISPTGEMYAISNSNSPRTLYRVDMLSGDLTQVGTFASNFLVNAIEFAPDGTLYGGFANLYKINPVNAEILQDFGRFGPAGPYPNHFINDLDWGADGIFRGINSYYQVRVAGPNMTALYTINPSGTPGSLATLVGTNSVVSLSSIASVPEPTTLLLALLGVSSVTIFGWRKRRSSAQANESN